MKLRHTYFYLVIGLLIGSLITYLIISDRKKENIVVRHNMIVSQIESLGNLEVVKYNIQDIVEYKKVRQFLPNAKTALIISGEVIGCVNLNKITAEDIFVDNDSIIIILPAPEVCHVRIDHSQSRIYNMEFGLWESDKIADGAYKQAESHLYEQAQKMDISEKSRENATQILTPLLRAFGFKHIVISFKPSTKIIEK